MKFLREKIDAGANLIFTQMFYDADGEQLTFSSLLGDSDLSDYM